VFACVGGGWVRVWVGACVCVCGWVRGWMGAWVCEGGVGVVGHGTGRALHCANVTKHPLAPPQVPHHVRGLPGVRAGDARMERKPGAGTEVRVGGAPDPSTRGCPALWLATGRCSRAPARYCVAACVATACGECAAAGALCVVCCALCAVTSFRDPSSPVFAVSHVAAALQYEYNGVALANLIEAIEVGNEVP
jgi:hypothetical protein